MAKSAGMMRVAGCPVVFTPHRGLKLSLRWTASIVEGNMASYVLSAADLLSGISFCSASLATPLPLLLLGAMSAVKEVKNLEQWDIGGNGGAAAAVGGGSFSFFA